MYYTAPTFEDTRYVHDYDCYRYYLPPIFVDDPVVMQIKVAQSNLTFKWWRDHHESIDCKLGQTCKYLLTNNNMVCALIVFSGILISVVQRTHVVI